MVAGHGEGGGAHCFQTALRWQLRKNMKGLENGQNWPFPLLDIRLDIPKTNTPFLIFKIVRNSTLGITTFSLFC